MPKLLIIAETMEVHAEEAEAKKLTAHAKLNGLTVRESEYPNARRSRHDSTATDPVCNS